LHSFAGTDSLGELSAHAQAEDVRDTEAHRGTVALAALGSHGLRRSTRSSAHGVEHDLHVVSRLGEDFASFPAVLGAAALLEGISGLYYITALGLRSGGDLRGWADFSGFNHGAVGVFQQEAAASVDRDGTHSAHGSDAADHFGSGTVAVGAAAALDHEA